MRRQESSTGPCTQVRAPRSPATPRLWLDDHEPDHDRRQQRAHVLPVGRAGEPEAEKRPVEQAAEAESAVERVARKRPEGQLDQIRIQIRGREVEEEDAFEQQHRDQSTERAHDQASQAPHAAEAHAHEELAQQVDGPALIPRQRVGGTEKPSLKGGWP
jgi:hypothetical protein